VVKAAKRARPLTFVLMTAILLQLAMALYVGDQVTVWPGIHGAVP
jgi:hypothetical protein